MLPSKVKEGVGEVREPGRRMCWKPPQRNNSTQAQNEGALSQDDSSLWSGIPTGSTVARDLDTTASSGPRRLANEKEAGPAESQATTGSGPPNISELHSTTENAYGGGLYGSEETVTAAAAADQRSPRIVAEGSTNHSSCVSRASDSQSVDGGPGDFSAWRDVDPPVSSGRADVDVTGQSYHG